MLNKVYYKVIYLKYSDGFDVIATNRENKYISAKYKTLEEATEVCNRLNSQFSIMDYDNTEILNWFENINFTELYNILTEKTGISIKDMKHFLNKNKYNHQYESVKVVSHNIVNQCSTLGQSMFSEAYIESFSGGINIDDKTGDLSLIVDIYLHYITKDNGQNWIGIATYKYKDGKWSDINKY